MVIHSSDDENILVFSKRAGGFEARSARTSTTEADDIVIAVINLDPHAARESMVHLDLPALGFDWSDTLSVHDEITGDEWEWGQHNYVRLDPSVEPAHILSVRSAE